MTTTKISDVIVPAEFTKYLVQNTMVSSAFVQSGIMTPNDVINAQLRAGAEAFSVPFWLDLPDDEANTVSDDPDVLAAPRKLQAGKQLVRKSFLHSSWAAMNLASELAGDDALGRIQDRAVAYWERQTQKRLISSLKGILAGNVLNNGGDMVLDISAEAGPLASFSPAAVIDAAGTLGDAMAGADGVTGIAMHSDLYRAALKDDLIDFVQPSNGSLRMPTYRGLAVIVDDGLPLVGGVYTCALFAKGAVGYGLTAPSIAEGTEIENQPSAGNGGGQQILHSRINLAVHPLGFQWVEGSLANESPTIADLALAAHWLRVVERKAAPIAFLKCKL